jgi:choline kinase
VSLAGARGIILAAGEGTRLKKYTGHLPKGMLIFGGKPLIQWQLEAFRRLGVSDVSVVRGFAGDRIGFPGVAYYENPDFRSTNMVASLFCAGEKLKGPVVVSYADILFEDGLLEEVCSAGHDINVAVDVAWRAYWIKRYGTEDFDTESLRLDGDRIVSLGAEGPPPGEIDARFVGLLRFSEAGASAVRDVWHKYRERYWDTPWQVSGKTLRNAYMTDLIQALIEEGYPVHALKTKNRWMEFDTNEDYEQAVRWLRDGTLGDIIRLGVEEAG